MEMKTCTKCRIEKQFAEFHRNADRPSGRAAYCKACKKKHTEANKEQILKRVRQWDLVNAERKRAGYIANAEKRREYQRAYSIRRTASNRERIAEIQRKYAISNPGKVNARTAHRYATKTQSTPAWADSKKIIEFYGIAAHLTRETGIPHQVDHIVPLRSKLVCGLHWEANLRVIPGAENALKSNRYWPDMP